MVSIPDIRYGQIHTVSQQGEKAWPICQLTNFLWLSKIYRSFFANYTFDVQQPLKRQMFSGTLFHPFHFHGNPQFVDFEKSWCNRLTEFRNVLATTIFSFKAVIRFARYRSNDQSAFSQLWNQRLRKFKCFLVTTCYTAIMLNKLFCVIKINSWKKNFKCPIKSRNPLKELLI